MSPTFGEEVSALGWASGSVVSPSNVPALTLAHSGKSPALVQDADWLVLISQTCDVVARKEEQEPFVELLHCRPIPKLRAGYKELRSTRCLDFKPNRESHANLALTAHATADRYLVPREVLRNSSPDQARRLSDVSTTRVLEWYSLRYRRPAWPNAFVMRTSPARDELELALEALADDIEVRVLIAEKDQELLVGDSYHITVFFIADQLVWESDPRRRQSIQQAFSTFVSTLKACDGVEVDEESEVRSGENFSWQETRETDEWNFANLSYVD